MLWVFISSAVCLVIYEKDALDIGTHRNKNRLHIFPFEKSINLRRQIIA
jgi:hypothetical protein